MKIRRTLATAVAVAAVTAPVMLLSAGSAFADTKPAPAAESKAKPSIEELRLAVTAAQHVYDEAVIAEAKATDGVKAVDKADHPLQVAAADAKKASALAAEAKKAADTKLADAKKAREELKPGEDTTAADKAVADAQTAADAAKTEAETKAAAAAEAVDKLDDASVEAFRQLGVAQTAKKDAAKKLDAAKRALADAEEEPDGCVDVTKSLTVSVTGPKTVAAGATGTFSVRVTNGTNGTLDMPGAAFNLVNAANGDDSINKFLDVKASVGGSAWQGLDGDFGVVALKAMKPGATADVKLRVAVNTKAPKAEVVLLAAAGYDNKDESCGWGGEADAEFAITKSGATKPTPKPTESGDGSTGSGNGNTTEQGGSSKTPVTGGTSGSTTGGNLAKTGAGSSTMPIALAGGAAVVLGAGAMVIVRRRKTNA
ncbi:LPXTG cell wall anchor domain-containing protein [Streptomyces sp. NPDC090025]|uniref:LPXTG cell wall anchor domain-containing protein n=1 Tax=Streptomyces sp. NPDC090025 TaxID=3365922 RepID=UPI003835B30F